MSLQVSIRQTLVLQLECVVKTLVSYTLSCWLSMVAWHDFCCLRVVCRCEGTIPG